MSHRRPRRSLLRCLAVATVVAGACSAPSASASGGHGAPRSIDKIRHVIVIMQENRSLDSYFGTYPGADGIPMSNGVPTACVPDPATQSCVKPYPDHADRNGGGPHDALASATDTDGGRMDGFVTEAERGRRGCTDPTNPVCTNAKAPDVMGYHTGSDIPNYWAYAHDFVLQDHLYEPVHTWSFPSHLAMVSGWSASCGNPANPMSCYSANMPALANRADPTPYAWTDITYLLHQHKVSWGWYLDHGARPLGVAPLGAKARRAAKAATTTTAVPGAKNRVGEALGAITGVPAIWNVLPGFGDVHQDSQLGNIRDLTDFYSAARAGSLPAVSWVLPDAADSEHPPALVSTGQSYVTRIVNAVMQSPDWGSTAIFLTWDDWGGFYDQVVPPQPDTLGYGIRVPGLVISPYAKAGYIDHQTLSFDAYLEFIEDDFLGGARLDPRTDGRPDSRTVVRENVKELGNLVADFDFNQRPRAPMILPVDPHTTLTGVPSAAPG